MRTAGWTITYIDVTCPHCGYFVGIANVGGPLKSWEPGSTHRCPRCRQPYRLPRLTGTHGPSAAPPRAPKFSVSLEVSP